MIHLELIVCIGMTIGVEVYLFFHMDILLFQHHLLEGLFFPPLNYFVPILENHLPM